VCTTETAADLAYEAALRALENGNTKPEELDMIICASVSGEDICPSIACMVQSKLGATCPAMDINAACSAFIYMLDTAAGFFARGRVKKMLVIGSERMSRILDWTDKTTCVIFGDGAGALLLGEGDGYLTSKLFAKGGDNVIKIPNFMGTSPFYENEQIKPYVYMQGQETFKFAVNAMCKDLREVIEQAGLTPMDVTYVVPHQANVRIIDAAKSRLGIPAERYCVNIDKYGNTSAASIPLVMDEINRAGKLKPGDILALAAFGGGLTSAACIIRW
ncbi:MAG: ketoacyl-ACP synthase III, partial [Clostridia bacterium]|nr:ketoacyl-ACP synthase III [Clostridia bacterium]